MPCRHSARSPSKGSRGLHASRPALGRGSAQCRALWIHRGPPLVQVLCVSSQDSNSSRDMALSCTVCHSRHPAPAYNPPSPSSPPKSTSTKCSSPLFTEGKCEVSPPSRTSRTQGLGWHGVCKSAPWRRRRVPRVAEPPGRTRHPKCACSPLPVATELSAGPRQTFRDL